MVWILLLACTSEEPPLDTGAVGCNGLEALCDRTLDQVVLPATHNSMSNADAGWWFPNQQHGLTRQLQDGIRGMLLDVHDEDGAPMLCHGECELGSQPLGEGLGEIRDFLVSHPNQVVAVIVEDYVSAQVMEQAVDDAGLTPLVYTPVAGPWPTLGELIEADTRLVLSPQGAQPPPDWYVNAWALYSDTAYSYDRVQDFDCALNRGAAENPLFLINHWTGPLPTVQRGQDANTAEVLNARVQDCLEVRGRLPTMLAVDFYDQGDLFQVVDALNRSL